MPPLADNDSRIIALRDELNALIRNEDIAFALARDAGLNTSVMPGGGAPFVFWSNIVRNANLGGKLAALVATVSKQYPENMAPFATGFALAPAPPVTEWKVPAVDGLEKILGKQSTLVDVLYLARGKESAASVAKVDGVHVGTGFLVAPCWFLTNHHVLEDEAQAQQATFVFNYQKAAGGSDETTVQASAVAGTFKTSSADDWSLVKLSGEARAFGYLSISRRDARVDDFVNIIQHAGGGYKQVSIQGNLVVYADTSRIQYLTDTLPGSSGSPVFDREWRVVGLHHAGGWVTRSGAARLHFCNEGIAASCLRDVVASVGM